MRSFEIRSPEMTHGGPMYTRHVHERSGGLNLSPPLHIEALPAEVRSISFMLVDRDANDFVHWAVVDLPRDSIRLPEGASGDIPEPARELYNTTGSRGYFGPNPRPRSGEHKYEVVAYGLDVDSLEIGDHANAAAFDAAARTHAVAMASTHWMYGKR